PAASRTGPPPSRRGRPFPAYRHGPGERAWRSHTWRRSAREGTHPPERAHGTLRTETARVGPVWERSRTDAGTATIHGSSRTPPQPARPDGTGPVRVFAPRVPIASGAPPALRTSRHPGKSGGPPSSAHL